MKSILKMIERLEKNQDSLKVTEDKIVDKIVTLLEKNEYLKKQEKFVENCDEDECYLSTNDIDGVDYRVEFDIKKLGLDIPENYLELAVEKYFDDTGIHFSAKNKEISTSTGEEIFFSHKGEIIFPNEEPKHNFIKPVDDFHAWLLIEEWMTEKGYFPGIYNCDYYGNVSSHKFDKNYGEFFPDDEKAKLKKINKYLSFYRAKTELDAGYRWNLSDLNEEIFNNLPQRLKDIHFDEPIAILEVKEIDLNTVTLHIEFTEDDETKEEVIEIRLNPNSIQFILQEDNPKGGIYEMSLVPV